MQTILLDIEGTTTPVAFVYEVLFPYARRGVQEFLEQHWRNNNVRADLERLRREHAADASQNPPPPVWQDKSPEAQVQSAVAYVHWLMDRDSKSTGLKSLQGKIWEAGYRNSELCGQVYADVAPAFARWSKQNKQISIFSSGSVLAQKLLFSATPAGDLDLTGPFCTKWKEREST